MATEVFWEKSALPVHSCLMMETREAALAFPRGDLALTFCRDCGFLYNALFDETVHDYSAAYEDTQGFSAHFRAFQERLCRDQIAKFGLDATKSALEIGCGKGQYLVELCERCGATGVGIDPACRPERITSDAPVEFIRDFYSPRYAHLHADYVCCRHTLEHIGPVHQFVRNVRATLDERPDTPVVFEVPDAERILVDQAFEDVYYEHCSYFTLGSLARLFRRCGFRVEALYKEFGDQYLLIEARPGDPASSPLLDAEDDLAQTAAQVRLFAERIPAKLTAFRAELDRWKADGRRVVFWGSGSKAVSYLSTVGITDELDAIVDINPHRHGKFLAGSGHRIDSPASLVERPPDVVVVMNAVYLEEIRTDLAGMGLTPELRAV